MLDTLLFSAEAIQDMWHYALNGPNNKEIGGIGRIQKDQFDIPYVSDVIILKQEVTAGHFNTKVEDIMAFFETIPEEQHPEWNFQWHSHVKMKTNPSETDLKNYKGFIELFDQFVPMIVNHYGEWSGWIYNSGPVAGMYPYNKIWVYEMKDHYYNSKMRFKQEDQYRTLEYILEAAGLGISKEREQYIKDQIKEKVSESHIPAYAGYTSAKNYGYNDIKNEWPQNQYGKPKKEWWEKTQEEKDEHLEEITKKNKEYWATKDAGMKPATALNRHPQSPVEQAHAQYGVAGNSNTGKQVSLPFEGRTAPNPQSQHYTKQANVALVAGEKDGPIYLGGGKYELSAEEEMDMINEMAIRQSEAMEANIKQAEIERLNRDDESRDGDALRKELDMVATTMGLTWSEVDECYVCPYSGDQYDYEELAKAMT